MRTIGSLFLAFVFAAAGLSAADAHFSEGVKVRTIVLTRDADGVRAFVRAPAPLLFGDLTYGAGATSIPRSDFISVEDGATGPVLHLSRDAAAAKADAFRKRLEDALSWSQEGAAVKAELTDYRIRAAEPESHPADAGDIAAAMAIAGAARDPLFGEAHVDMTIRLALPDPDGPVTVVSGYPPIPVIEGVTVENVITDARKGRAATFTVRGQLEEPATIGGPVWRTVAEFVKQGVLHIVEGIDHVFLVVSLALGIGARRRLIWVVTAFTLGHSVTLIATFLGAAPDWPWFIPAVETAIAATVLYAAAAAFFRRMDSIAVIAGVGLLHGLGFSFVLGDILGRDSPQLIPALAAFNVGIEIGQLAIIAVTLAAVAVSTRLSTGATPVLRNAALAAIAAISAWWVIERGTALVA